MAPSYAIFTFCLWSYDHRGYFFSINRLTMNDTEYYQSACRHNHEWYWILSVSVSSYTHIRFDVADKNSNMQFWRSHCSWIQCVTIYKYLLSPSQQPLFYKIKINLMSTIGQHKHSILDRLIFKIIIEIISVFTLDIRKCKIVWTFSGFVTQSGGGMIVCVSPKNSHIYNWTCCLGQRHNFFLNCPEQGRTFLI